MEFAARLASFGQRGSRSSNEERALHAWIRNESPVHMEPMQITISVNAFPHGKEKAGGMKDRTPLGGDFIPWVRTCLLLFCVLGVFMDVGVLLFLCVGFYNLTADLFGFPAGVFVRAVQILETGRDVVPDHLLGFCRCCFSLVRRFTIPGYHHRRVPAPRTFLSPMGT